MPRAGSRIRNRRRNVSPGIDTKIGEWGRGWSTLRTNGLAHPIYKHLADGALLASAEAHVPAGAWTPKFLNSHQNETLMVLAERIVPNSGKAQVNRFIDLLLSVDNAETREKFNESLAVFDRESMSRFGHAFKDVSEAQQNELLTAFCAETLSFSPNPLGGNRRGPS